MAFLELLILGLTGLIIYLFYNKYKKEVSEQLDEILRLWPIPNWLNYLIGIPLILIVFMLQFEVLFESFIIWLSFIFVIPFLFFSIKKTKVFNVFQALTIFITLCYGFILFANIHRTRDSICDKLLNNYNVEYSTEYYEDSNGGEHEQVVSTINAGNDSLDFVLEELFPVVYGSFIALLLLLSVKINISIRRKFNIIQEKL